MEGMTDLVFKVIIAKTTPKISDMTRWAARQVCRIRLTADY